MPATQQQRDDLLAAIAAAIKSSTTSDGRQFQYQPLEEMIQALALIDAELAGMEAEANPQAPPLTTFAAISRD